MLNEKASQKPGKTLPSPDGSVQAEVQKQIEQLILSKKLPALLAEANREGGGSAPSSENAWMSAVKKQAREVALETARQVVREEGAQMRSLVVEALSPVIEEHVEQLKAQFIPKPTVVEVHCHDIAGERRYRLTGLQHRQFTKVLRIVTSRTAAGFPVPVWLYGAPGAGKNQIADQVAKALSLQYYLVPLGPTSTESKITGYTNMATGKFVPGLLHEPFRNGGVAFLDEIDAADPGVLVGANALISNDSFRFPDGSVVQRHRDFFLLAGANTIGAGSTAGFMRNKMDAALLDRFVKVEIEYDLKLEAKLCSNRKWVTYVQRVRAYVATKVSKNVHITPRMAIHGAALLGNGVPWEDVVETVLLAELGDEVKRGIKQNVER